MDDTDHPQSPERGKRFRRNLVAAGAALGLTLGGLGIAAAQTGDSSTTTTAPSDGARGPGAGRHGPKPGLDAAATALGVSPEELRTALQSGQSIAQVAESKGVATQTVIDAMVADARTRVAAKVESGDLTQAQVDKKLANVEQRITDLVNRTGGPGRGPGRPGPAGDAPS